MYFTHLRSCNFYMLEVFLLFRLAAISISTIAVSMLVQDKTCLVTFQQSAQFCGQIQSEQLAPQMDTIRDEILSSSASFANYRNAIECIPMLAWSLFVGSFLDRHSDPIKATSVILLLNVIANIFNLFVYIFTLYAYHTSPYYLLIAAFSVWFSGGMISMLTTVYKYIITNTQERQRNLKFVLLEIIFIIGASLSVFAGGQLLVTKSTSGEQLSQHSLLRSYSRNFGISFLFDILSLVALVALHKLQRNRNQSIGVVNEGIEEVCDDDNDMAQSSMISYSSNYSDDSLQPLTLADKTSTRDHNHNKHYGSTIEDCDEDYRVGAITTATSRSNLHLQSSTSSVTNFLTRLFDLENARQTIRCLMRVRANHVRLQIFLLYLILFSQSFTTQGVNGVLLQFSQKVYSWDATQYSTITAFSQIVSMALLAIGSTILVKVLALEDGTLIIVSQLSAFARNILMGTILTPAAYFVSIIVGSLSGFTVVCARTKLSKIVSADEVGKIFSLSTSMDALVPFLGSIIYTNLFAISIAVYPGLIYQFSAFVIFLSLLVIVFEEFYCPVKSLNDAAVSSLS